MGNKLLFATIAIFLIFTQVNIFIIDRPVWNDTAFTLETIQRMHERGWNFDWKHYDVHPFGYYSVLYVWEYMNPGMTEYHWAEELSVLFGLVFFTLIFLGMRKLFPRYGELAVATMAFFSTYNHYFTEARMYGLVMMLSAILFYLVVVKRLRSRSVVFWAMFVSILFPLVHYLAAIIPPFYVLFHMVLSRVENKEWSLKRKDDRFPLIWVFVGWLVGVVCALTIFLPQRARIDAMWLPQSNVTSWPSSVIFSMLYTEGMDMTWWGTLSYFTIIVLMVLGVVYIYFQLSKGKKDAAVMAMMMGSALMPLIFLAADSITHLYHHRYFLGVIWMFAAVMMTIVWKVVIESFDGCRNE